jgi:hypothetical protein
VIEISIDGEKVAECESLEFDRDVLEGPSRDGYTRSRLPGNWAIKGKIKDKITLFARSIGQLESEMYYNKVKSHLEMRCEFEHPSGPVIWMIGDNVTIRGQLCSITAKQELRQV